VLEKYIQHRQAGAVATVEIKNILRKLQFERWYEKAEAAHRKWKQPLAVGGVS